MPGPVQAARVVAWIQGGLWALPAFAATMSLLLESDEALAGRDAGYRAGYMVAGLLTVVVLIALASATIVTANRLGQARRGARTALIALESALIGLAALIATIGLIVAVSGSGDRASAGAIVAVMFFLIGLLPTAVVVLLTRPGAGAFFARPGYGGGHPVG